MEKSRLTQKKELLELFENTPVLTVQYIQHKLNMNSPRKRISDLVKDGYPIESRWLTHIGVHGEVTRYKEYWMRRTR